MFKSIVILPIFFVASPAFAIVDFMSKKAEDLAKVAFYTDAIADLVSETAPNSSLEKTAKESRDRSSKIYQDAQNLYYVGEETRSLFSGPDIGGDNLEDNIRASTNYIKKVKNLSLKLAVLGTDGFTALNSLQTNQTLEQIRKNQAAEIAMAQQYNQAKAQKESIEDSKMRGFIIQQRAIRKASLSQAR